MLGEELSRALSDISDDKIAEAAAVTAAPRKRVWPGLVAAAAALALLLSASALLWPAETTPDTQVYLPILAIRAYAADGSIATLSTTGDTAQLQPDVFEFFPGKEVYTLDVSLTDAAGTRLDLTDCEFSCFHRGKTLQPGESDESIAVILVDEGDFYGYRIVGWCEEYTNFDVTIRGADGLIQHQKELRIDYDGQYHARMMHSYDYEPELPTEELIAKLFDSEYFYWRTMLASSPSAEYSILVSSVGGFDELERRSDAASLLLQRWMREMEESEYNFVSVQGSGRVGLVLAQTPHWRNLTEEERALIESYGISRGCPEPEENYYFPGHRIFDYDLLIEEHNPRECTLEISYNGTILRSGEDRGKDEHFYTSRIYGSLIAEDVQMNIRGWSIVGWFDESTEITLSVYFGEELIRQEVLLITPSEDRYDQYQIDILETIP